MGPRFNLGPLGSQRPWTRSRNGVLPWGTRWLSAALFIWFGEPSVVIVGLCLEFVPSLCRTYDITIAALPLYSVIALRAQLSSAVKRNLLYQLLCGSVVSLVQLFIYVLYCRVDSIIFGYYILCSENW